MIKSGCADSMWIFCCPFARSSSSPIAAQNNTSGTSSYSSSIASSRPTSKSATIRRHLPNHKNKSGSSSTTSHFEGAWRISGFPFHLSLARFGESWFPTFTAHSPLGQLGQTHATRDSIEFSPQRGDFADGHLWLSYPPPVELHHSQME